MLNLKRKGSFAPFLFLLPGRGDYSCVVVDPFFLLLKELGIEVVNYYELLDSIEKSLKVLDFYLSPCP